MMSDKLNLKESFESERRGGIIRKDSEGSPGSHPITRYER
jgi:hypothetical protein